MTKKSNDQVSKINGAKRRQRALRRADDTARPSQPVALPASVGYPICVALLRVAEHLFADNVAVSVVAALVVGALNLLNVWLSRRHAADTARPNPSRSTRSR